jgi:hypothetical protein
MRRPPCSDGLNQNRKYLGLFSPAFELYIAEENTSGMSRHLKFPALSRVLIGAVMLSCISCIHVLKPPTPAFITTCHYTPDQFEQDLKAYRAAMPNDAVAQHSGIAW